MTPDLIPIFVNGRPIRATPGASLATVLASHDPDLLGLLMDGAVPTDARGLPVDPDAPLVAGTILRLQRSARGEGAADA